jgi:thymidylate synthase ThyX
MNLKKLSKLFTRRKTSFGADVTVWDEMDPEESAMVQSLNSRSAGGFWVNLLIVIKEGPEKFMAKFYSGYGHKSIADCGSTTAAFDSVSMLAAKEVQNHWAYNGQETSTRYVEITNLGYLNPLNTVKGNEIMIKWFNFYKKALEPTIAHLKTIRPRKTEGEKPEDEEKYNIMIEKRAYDVLGSFLPAGTKTNVSCHMELRQWDDKMSYMIHHPLTEISELAEGTLDVLIERYPSTFIKKKVYEQSEQYRKYFQNNFSYSTPPVVALEHKNFFKFLINFFDKPLLHERYKNILLKRPVKTEVPKIVNETAGFRLEFNIDFRSHRDLQRQRSALQRVPLLTTKIGFEEWYLNQMPADLRKEAELLLAEQKEVIDSLDCDAIVRQYYIPMGYKVFNTFTVSLADLIYIIELRTPTTVHPTARKIGLLAYEALTKTLVENDLGDIKIYAETSQDDFDIKRADHDIYFGDKKFSDLK